MQVRWSSVDLVRQYLWGASHYSKTNRLNEDEVKRKGTNEVLRASSKEISVKSPYVQSSIWYTGLNIRTLYLVLYCWDAL